MKVWDIISPRELRLKYLKSRVNKFFSGLERRSGIVGNKAVIFVYNKEMPELSYILTEEL